MDKGILVVLAVLLFTSILSATNHLDIMTSMQGEHHNSRFGKTMATLDFNHDGIDDLIICSPEWKDVYPAPFSSAKGRVDIYFGGTNFDNVADISLLGQYAYQYHNVVNIGDVNGDGYDDLYIGGDEPDLQPTGFFLRIYTGGDPAPSEPDILIPYTLDPGANLRLVGELGDFNGDGKDDVGFSTSSSSPGESYYIVWGGSFVVQYVTNSCAHSTSYPSGFNGIGDINNDGFDDFSIGYTNPDPYIGYHLITLYFGNAESNFNNYMILTQTQAGISKISNPLGDINGDGIDDFMGYQSNAGLNIWLGATETDTIPNLALNPPWQGGEFGQSLKYGDLNNDGFDDIVGTNYYANQFQVWLGRAQVNGISDLLITAPYISANPLDYFGFWLTTGDYNADGCCDIAVSAPETDYEFATDYRGYVYVYAGNTELADTTVGIDDPLSPTVTNQITMSISPNPVRINDRYIAIKLQDNSAGEKNPIDISIYNIRGQCVLQTHLNKNKISDTFMLDISKMASGIYLCQVKSGNRVKTKKISIIR